MPPADVLAPTDELVREWLTENLGTVTSLQRQARWRPVWFADVERDGRSMPLCIRGDRVDCEPAFSLHHEMVFQSLLDEAGIPVPKVHGWSDSPMFYVMDRVGGQEDFAGSTDAERHQAVDEYLQILARMHTLDLRPFIEAGIVRGARPEDSGLIGIQRFEDAFHRSKVRPDPLMEWGLSWLRRNALDNPGREGPIVWDSGQFHQDHGRIVAVMDVELGHLGDPMMDLAGWRMRDTVRNFGDFSELYRRYGELRGEPVDLAAIEYHHFAFTMSNQLSFHAALAAPVPGSAYMTNLQWCSETNVMMVEAMAELRGIELEELTPPPAEASPVAVAHAHLISDLRAFPAGDEQTAYAARSAFRLARHLARFEEIGEQIVAADLDDLEPLLGHRPGSWADGEQALEQFVLADQGAHDDELLTLFNRRTRRAQMLLGPAGSSMVTHHKVQPFRR